MNLLLVMSNPDEPGALLDTSARALFPSDEAFARQDAAVSAALAAHGSCRMQLEMRHGDGTRLWVDAYYAQVPGSGDVLASFADLTPGSGHGWGGFVNVGRIEVYGRPVPR